MLDCIQDLGRKARPLPGQFESADVDYCLRLLRQHRLVPQLISTRYGPSAGGLALRVSVSSYLDSPAVASELNDRLRFILDGNVPLTIALTDPGHENVAADTHNMLEAFCSSLRDALPAHSLDPGLLGTSIRSHVVPLQAYLVITSILGKGPRYVMLDCLQMQHHKDARVQATTDANWLELWHRRQSACTAQAVYAESVRSHCSLLADEKTASVLPALAMPVPAESAWLPVEMYLPDFADSRGHLIMPAIRVALRACLEANESLAPQLHWPSELQRQDARTNNRVALLLTGIGDLVSGRGMQPSEIHSLRWADSIVRAVQGELLNTSREMARNNDTLPSLLQSDPSNMWHNFEQQHNWSSRWHQTLQAEAVRHRNLLVLSPYSVLPRGSKCSPDFADLLPVLEHADAISFRHAPTFANWNVNEFSRFHRRAWAVIMRGGPRQHIAAGA
jgi:hypothetical protein